MKIKTKEFHGLSSHKLYSVWESIIQRTNNPNNPAYKYYGARNITICEEWRNSFKSFYDWAIANGYKTGLTIDRSNNDLGYSPDNCRWENMTIQLQNTRNLHSHNKSGYRNIYWHSGNKKWAVCFSIKNKHKHIGVYSTIEEAIFVRNKFILDNNMATPLI